MQEKAYRRDRSYFSGVFPKPLIRASSAVLVSSSRFHAQNYSSALYFEISTPPVAPNAWLVLVKWYWRGRGKITNLLNVTVDGELTGSDTTNHDKTRAKTGEAATDTKLLTDLGQTGHGALSGETLGLVDLGEHGVGGLGDNGGGHTGDEARAEVDGGLSTTRGGALVDAAVDLLADLLVDDELGHGVRNPNDVVSKILLSGKLLHILLKEDGTKAGVESANTFLPQDLPETADQTVGEGGLGDEADTGSLKGAEGNVSEELSSGSGGEVDGSAVVGGSLITECVDALLLEELVSSELESTLEEVTSGGRAETGPDSTEALVRDDFPKASDHAIVVSDGVELEPGLDAATY